MTTNEPATSSEASTATPWEPPLAGNEAEAVLGALDRQRWTFRWKAGDLDSAGLTARVGASTLTLGGLLKHLAVAEDYYSTVKLSGAEMDATWESNGWDGDNDWELSSAADDSPAHLYALYDGAVDRARSRFKEALDADGPAQSIAAADDDGNRANPRRLLLDMVEEYGRHTGHADILREAVDGRVGEDPPPGWQP